MVKIGLSREINKDSFNCSLNALLSFKSIEKLSNLDLWPSSNIWSKIELLSIFSITPLTSRFVKIPKTSAIFDHILLDGHKAGFDNFSILLKESNAFILQLKESFLISHDKPILNKNIYFFPLELIDCYLIFIIFVIPCQYIIVIWNCNHGEIVTVW